MSTEQAAVVGFPVEKLTEPQSSDPVPNLVELVINGNGVSLTYHLNNLIAIITDFDCLTTFTNNVTGDWEGLQKAADAIRKLTEYNKAYHEALDAAMDITDPSWKGNAATGARQFFDQLTGALDAQNGPMEQVAREIDAFALSAYNLANGLAAIVQFLVDSALTWLITITASAIKKRAAAAVTGTGVGAVAAAGLLAAAAALDAVAASLVVRMLGKVTEAIGMVSTGVNWGEGLGGLVGAKILDAVESARIPELSAATYDHPGV